jgi:hypothetical protein
MFFITMKVSLQWKCCKPYVDVQGIWNFVSTLVHLMHVVFCLIKQLGLNLTIWFVYFNDVL